MRAVNFRIPIQYNKTGKLFYEQLRFEIVFESKQYGWISLQSDNLKIGLSIHGIGASIREIGGNIDYAFLTEDFKN